MGNSQDFGDSNNNLVNKDLHVSSRGRAVTAGGFDSPAFIKYN